MTLLKFPFILRTAAGENRRCLLEFSWRQPSVSGTCGGITAICARKATHIRSRWMNRAVWFAWGHDGCDWHFKGISYPRYVLPRWFSGICLSYLIVLFRRAAGHTFECRYI